MEEVVAPVRLGRIHGLATSRSRTYDPDTTRARIVRAEYPVAAGFGGG